jgi:glycosyltransferase involved in cell wall biosynthesis
MKVIVVLEHRFVQTPDGEVWTQTTFPYSFWQMYLEVFDQVHVVARLCKLNSVSSDFKRSDGDGVSFADVPNYVGLFQYLFKASQVNLVVRNSVGENDAVIIRVASHLANCLYPVLSRRGQPYGVQVVADPYDVFAPNSVRNPLRPFFRWFFPRQLKEQCAKSVAAAYVTKYQLQHRYPPGSETFSTHFSDVELPSSGLMPIPRLINLYTKRINLIFVGTLAQLYKAPDILVEAVVLCIKEGLDVALTLVGEGKHRGELEEKVFALGLSDRIQFLGQLASGSAIQTQLEKADVFVLPSYQEGLPRAMVEAMSQALPCIGSTVGGIPELLPPEDMVPPGNVLALAQKIREVVTDPERMAKMSSRNLATAQDYRDEILQERRTAYYRHLRQKTEEWLNAKAG